MNTSENNLDLFPTASIPKFQESETLYSWCGRFHQLSCNTSERNTSRQLFRHPSAGFRPDFPTPVGHIHSKSKGHLESLEEFITNRTMFGFYRPFLPLTRANALATAIESGTYQHVNQQLGLPASLPELSNLLKACAICLEEDFTNFSFSWWRMRNQWPSTLVCIQHQQPLIYVRYQFRHDTLKDWILPCRIQSSEFWQDFRVSEAMLYRMSEITNWGHSIGSESNIFLDTTILRYCYLLKAKEDDYLAMDGSVKLIHLKKSFLDWIGDCVQLPTLSFAKQIQDPNAGFIGQLIRQYPGIRHPLKHILMIAFLFKETRDFFEMYDYVSSIYNLEGDLQLRKKLKNVQDTLLNLVSNENRSVNSAAAELGVSVTQAIKLLKKTQTPYQKRPKILGSEKEKDLSKALFAGEDRARICQKLNIRKSFIKDYLAANPILKSEWEKKHKIKLIKIYRKRFLNILKANPGLPVKKLKGIRGNGIQWLQRHDKKWLENNLPNFTTQY
jgi:hypothetical protein